MRRTLENFFAFLLCTHPSTPNFLALPCSFCIGQPMEDLLLGPLSRMEHGVVENQVCLFDGLDW